MRDPGPKEARQRELGRLKRAQRQPPKATVKALKAQMAKAAKRGKPRGRR